VKRSEEAGYRDYVVARMDPLRRTAYLLCRNWHTADDLVAITLGKLYRHWRRVNAAEHLDAYVRRILVRTWLDERGLATNPFAVLGISMGGYGAFNYAVNLNNPATTAATQDQAVTPPLSRFIISVNLKF